MISKRIDVLPHIVCMGVAGSGKSVFGTFLATQLQRKFIEGDRLHRKSHIRKMSKGIALQDDDRREWLRLIRSKIDEHESSERIVLSCSALKREYRQFLSASKRAVHFFCFHAEYDIIKKRLESRKEHFMPVSLLQSQYRDLELPVQESNCTIIDVNKTMEEIYETCREELDALRQNLSML